MKASGAVRLFHGAPGQPIVEGRLLDISEGGFRASHCFPGLSAGQIVHFEHAWRSGRARLIWTRITAEEVESGFCYVDEL